MKNKNFLLCLDIGNTNIVAGIYNKKKLIYTFRIATEINKTSDDLGILFKSHFDFSKISFLEINAIIICSVVPPIERSIKLMCEKYFSCAPLFVGNEIKPKIKILYDIPEEVGADRIVNAIAGYNKYPTPLVIVDFGTATTFDVISKNNEYLGGAISPGISTAAEALFKNAAKLPRVDLKAPRSVIGKNTVESMQSGIVFGFTEQVDGMIRRIKEELKSNVYVVATGGLAEIIAPHTKTIQIVNPILTLEGLRLIYEQL